VTNGKTHPGGVRGEVALTNQGYRSLCSLNPWLHPLHRSAVLSFWLVSTTYYRHAQPADQESIIDFQIAMAWETEEVRLHSATVSAGVRAVFEDPALGRYFVAELDSRVVAVTLTTYEWSEWRNGVVWWIQSVYVTPEFRRQGIYSGIYAFIRGLAESDPAVRGIRLYVDRRNKSAQEVYTRLGMNGEHYQVFEWMK